ncbi:MAG: PBP1A family penicillin-binding protein [Desulfobacterales bacterium]|nr:PBP1A family penicillin-binding protein [Desulfobacterales bacterium]
MRRFFKWIGILLIIGIMMAAAGIGGLYVYFAADLPKIVNLNDYQPPVITTVYSQNNKKIAEFYNQRRIVIALEEMPEDLLNAFVAAEDARFYEHEGIDLHSIIRAFFKNLEAGRIVQGGSTITQQVAKSFFLTPERSYSRKIKEAILAYRIDKRFSKKQILFLYLNQIYLGHGAYGIEAAAQNYFGKSADNLYLAECAMLAGLPQAPSRYSPYRHPELAKQRQIYVLNRMVQEGMVSRTAADQAIDREHDIKGRKNWYMENVPYYTEHIRQTLVEKYGKKKVYTDGLKVYTAVDEKMQEMARDSVQKALYALDKRQGFRGPIKELSPEAFESFSKDLQAEIAENPLKPGDRVKGVVIEVDDAADTVTVRMGNERGVIALADMRWARPPDTDTLYTQDRVKNPGSVLSVGDVIQVRIKEKPSENGLWQLALSQTPKVQAALMCIETGTGHVKTMIGGRDFSDSQFNRAIQSRRQPGSAFKPIIYAAALDKGYTPATVIFDSPIVFKDTRHDFTWKPKNYDQTFHGRTLFRTGLIKSRNIITVKILRDIGIDYTIEYARKLGIKSHLSRDLSLALGSSGISLLEIGRAYSVFANQGSMIEPQFITRIEDRQGNVIYEPDQAPEQVIEKSTAYIITHLLKEVVEHGTGWRVRALERPVAGKTGTTNNLYDAWFVGYTPRYVTAVWVGFDEEAPLGRKETGSRAASPIWLDFMKQALADKPEKIFPVPDSVVFSKIDLKTGLLPIPESRHTAYECFKEGTAPKQKTQAPDAVDSEEFYKKGLN